MHTDHINGAISFFCDECGYEKSGPPGYSADLAYEFITQSKRRARQKKISRGFPTSGNRRKSSDFKQETKESLETDIEIEENAKQIYKKIEMENVPEPLEQTLMDRSHLPVYFEKLPKIIPPLGKPIEESIALGGLRKKLKKKGIERLYQYQDDVATEILDGNNVIISAPTGLGKTEAFLLPLLHTIIRNNPDPRYRKGPQALLIYPTKALAADQRQKIWYYCSSLGLRIETFDGDTPRELRNQIYSQPPDLIITNADMLHYHLKNPRFQVMAERIKYVVIDEIHLCVGSYGTNVLWILRRLRRFSPNFQSIGASATISNAKNFGETIFDQPVKLVSLGTARKSDMYLTMLYPRERSNLSTMAQAAENFVSNGNRTLVFGNGHLSAESINLMLKQRGIRSEIHRAGLSYHHRKKVEEQFKDNELDVLVSTPTLELGIDIGSLDSVVSMLTGLTSFVQRIGRAGRKGQDAFATLVLRGDDPISAYYARKPEDYLTELDPAYVEPDNPFVARYQVLSMIVDRKLTAKEALSYQSYINNLQEEGLIRQDQDRSYIIANSRAVNNLLKDYSIRGIGNSVDIWNMKIRIGERSLPMALSELHPGAIYLHGGNSYTVQNYDPKLYTAKVSKISTRTEKTQAMRGINPEILQVYEEGNISGLETAYCELQLTETVHGYLKQNIFTNKVVGKYSLDKPIDYTFSTMGFLISLPRPNDFVDHLSKTQLEQVLGGTYHAIEHVLIESGNSFSGGGANQIGGISLGTTGLVFVYDGTEGGSGLSRLLYDSLEKGIDRTLNILEKCPCNRRDGCPRCTYSYYCGNNNQPLDRLGAIESLKLFGRDSTSLSFDFEGVETFVIEPDLPWHLRNLPKI